MRIFRGISKINIWNSFKCKGCSFIIIYTRTISIYRFR
nr:MAG TPA: Orsellinic acid biosynthesis cluster protein D [Bacteriophage sp.]